MESRWSEPVTEPTLTDKICSVLVMNRRKFECLVQRNLRWVWGLGVDQRKFDCQAQWNLRQMSGSSKGYVLITNEFSQHDKLNLNLLPAAGIEKQIRPIHFGNKDSKKTSQNHAPLYRCSIFLNAHSKNAPIHEQWTYAHFSTKKTPLLHRTKLPV